MTSLRDAAQQALEAMKIAAAELDSPYTSETPEERVLRAAITALKAALAEPAQEPMQESALQAVAEKIGDQCAVWYGIGARDVEEVLREAARYGLVRAAQAEPVAEPDSPERRCGGPGCDLKCCQPVQEPVTRLFGTLPVYDTPPQHPAEPVQEPIGYLWPTGRHPEFRFTQQKRDGIDGTPVYTAPPQRKPLSEDEIMAVYTEFMLYEEGLTPSGLQRVTRAVEAAHGIKE